ncbi:MAG: glycosyltransferase family protein, partial [Nanoarchaeota archaeon]
MAKIIYGIQSDGLGHYSRSKLVIDHLLKKGHEVKVITSDRPYNLMKDKYDVEFIERINFIYEQNRVNYTKTIYHNFVKFPEILNNGIRKIRKIFDEFNPDISITDAEIFTARVSVRKKVPLISIDNIHSIARTDAPKYVKKKFKFFEAEQRAFVEILTPRSNQLKHYFI